MYCPSCGHEVEENQKFCHDCGRSLAGVTDGSEPLTIRPTPDPPTDLSGVRDAAPDAQSAVDGEGGGDGVVRTDVFAGGGRSEDLPDIGEMPTREIRPRTPIPDPDWATPTGEQPAAPAVDPASDPTTTVPMFAPPAVDDTAETPVAANANATTQMPTQAAADSTTTMSAVPGGSTDEFPAIFDGSDDIYEYPEAREPFKLRLLFVFAFFGAIAVLMSAIADIIDIRTSAPVDGIATGVRTLDTLGTNLAVAGFLGATVMALGGLLACFGFRWGAGLAGGAGLALVGWAAMVAGLAQLRIASAESITRQTTDVAFTLRITRDLGFWLVVAVAAIGLLVFLMSLRSFGTGGRAALNPWIAALGAVAGVVLVAGPLLPVGRATFANNFRSPTTTLDLPTLYFGGRLAQLALVGFAVVFGLLIVRAYGLGLAAGGISVAFWMWLSSLLDIGTFPLGIAAGNFGAEDTTPHAVTSVGMAATIFLLIVAAILAVAGNRRQPQRY